MNDIKFYLILLALTPTVLGQCTKETAQQYFGRSVYEFSIGLSQRIAVETEHHFIASTLSPWTLLAALSLVAGEDTYKDMKQGLRLHTQRCFNDQMFKVIKDIETNDDSVILKRSAAIYVDLQLILKDTFYSKLQSPGVIGRIEALDFDYNEEVAERINEFVRSTTWGKINEAVSSEDLYGVQMLLIDAIYFKGSWTTEFDVERTQVSDFYGPDGRSKIGDVNMMFAPTWTKHIYLAIVALDVLELPYGNGKFSMLVYLPHPGNTVSDVIETMGSLSLKSVLYALDQKESEIVNVYLPRFNMTSDLDNLKELLSDMHLGSIFTSNADFSGITEDSLYVTNLLQKSTVEVNEHGSEASSATEVLMTFKSLPREFKVDRPFFFMIVDRQRAMPIFTGAYSKPSL